MMRMTTLYASQFQPTILFLSRLYSIVDEPKAFARNECYLYQYSQEKNGQSVAMGYGELSLREACTE